MKQPVFQLDIWYEFKRKQYCKRCADKQGISEDYMSTTVIDNGWAVICDCCKHSMHYGFLTAK